MGVKGKIRKGKLALFFFAKLLQILRSKENKCMTQ